MKPIPTPDDDAHTRAVQGLFLQYQPVIRTYVLSLVPDFSMADDVMQETFLVVTKKAASFEQGTNFPAWVRAICRFKVLETLRGTRPRFQTFSSEVMDALSAEPRDFIRNTDERLLHLESCMEKLAPQARRSIDLRYQNDHLPPQIASLMGCTVESVNVTLSRARAFLRECVQRRLSGTT